MCKSIQGFMGNVFCGSLPRSNLKLENELALFWDRTWKGGVEWCRCYCEEGLESKTIPQSMKEAPRCIDVVQFLKEGLSSRTPNTYERSQFPITRHF